MTVVMGETLNLPSSTNNHFQPEISALVERLRARASDHPDAIREQAPRTIAQAARWVLDNAETLVDNIISAGHSDFSRPMLLEAFDNTLHRWTDADRLKNLQREDTHAPRNARVRYPKVVFINLAGNLFLSGWEAITHAALIGASSIVRCSEADRVFPGIWARALARFSPLGSDVAVICEWPREDYGRFCAVTEKADAVVAFGGDRAVENVRQITPWNTPFAGHGSTVSLSLITAEELRHSPVELLADQCAYDFAIYDQQGCLSPRAIFVQDTDSRDVDRFVDALHGAMVNWQSRLPRRQLTLEDSAALARSRDEVLLDAACGGQARRVSTDSDPFLVTVKPASYFTLGPVNRYADIYLFNSLDEVENALRPLTGRISTIGVVHPGQSASTLINSLRITRVCEVGSMQRPPLAWYLDGLRPLQKLLRIQTIQSA